MTNEQIKFFSQDNTFLRCLEVAVVKAAQAISGEEPGPRKTLSGQVLDNSMWARTKFSINVAAQSGVGATVTVVQDDPEKPPVFTISDMTAFDTAVENAVSAVWNAEAKV